MKKSIRRAVIAGTLILFSASPLTQTQQVPSSRQQQNPSLADTETWIAQSFGEGKHYHPYFIDHAIQRIKFLNIGKTDGTQCYMWFEVTNNDAESVDKEYWKTLDNGKADYESLVRFDQLIDLADIDPRSIKASEVRRDPENATGPHTSEFDRPSSDWQDNSYVLVNIQTTNDKDSIVENTRNLGGKGKTYRSMEHEVGFPDPNGGIAVKPDYAPQFMKALRRSVELCGGKPSTF
jgi:hypothetical protein